MHPWMVQQLASEHRRDLLAQASRRRLVKGILAGRRRARPTARAPVDCSFAPSAVPCLAC
jgi:hypothetical protein